MKRAFEVKQTFFLVSQVLSFRHTKQTSKNVADTTFNNEDVSLGIFFSLVNNKTAVTFWPPINFT